jgi:subtilisin family serine protease
MTGVLSVRRTPGYAKKASVINDQVDLSKYQDPSTTFEFIAGHIDNASNSSSINVSAGTDIPTSNLTFDQIATIIAKNTILTRPTNAVVVVAAGNSGAPCLSTNLGGCNLLAALFALAPQTKASTIVVGALTGSGINEQIATYSVRAGALADRFIVASGESGESGVFGTSFAAPKVAGAIALVRQKYPNLTAAEAANLLLLTASKDINNDGKPDFTGVSSVYGHGKLDLSKALSPIGSAAIK